MKKFLIASAAAAIAVTAPALASTLEAVTANGIVLSTQGFEIPITYNEDGTFTGDAMGTTFAGKWRIEGNSLCTSSDFQPEESCTEYPEGKGPGDSFELQGDMGPVTITINE